MDPDLLHDLLMDGYGVVITPINDGDGDWTHFVKLSILAHDEEGVLAEAFVFRCPIADIDAKVASWLERE